MTNSDSSDKPDPGLNNTEQEIIEFIEANGNSTPAFIASELDLSNEYVRGLLTDLERLGYTKRLHRGLYALSDRNL